MNEIRYNITPDFERLKEHFPLLTLGIENEGRSLSVRIPNHGGTYYISAKEGWHGVRNELAEHHCKAAIEKDLNEAYPNLFCSLFDDNSGYYVSVWRRVTNPDGSIRDGSAMVGALYLHKPETYAELTRLNGELEAAKGTDHFWCSGHDRVEPKSEYGYFWFAGTYCKAYGEEHPEHRRSAERETYN